MALVWIALHHDKPADYRRVVAANVHQALVETFAIAGEDLVQMVAGGEPQSFRYDHCIAHIERSVELVLIQVTAEDTRSAAQKRAFYRRVVELLGTAPGIQPDDIVVNLIDVPKENWFVGATG